MRGEGLLDAQAPSGSGPRPAWLCGNASVYRDNDGGPGDTWVERQDHERLESKRTPRAIRPLTAGEMKRPTRALSIRQPYAEQILRATKRVEFRSVPTRIIDERVYVYASLTAEPGGEHLPRGVLVGTVEIARCSKRAGQYRWHLRRPNRLRRPLRPRNHPQPVRFRRGWAIESQRRRLQKEVCERRRTHLVTCGAD